MFKVVAVTLAAIVAVGLFAKSYFARTHSFEVYLREREKQKDGNLQKRLEAVEKLRLSGDKALLAEQYTDAEREYLMALKKAEQFGLENMMMASCYHDLAALYSAQEKFTEAEPLFRKAAQIWEVTRGPNDPYVATALNNLAGLLRAIDRAVEAALLEARVAAIRGTNGGAKTQ